VLPDGCGVVLERGSWPVPPVFAEIQRRGDVADDEMARVFNLGLGMVAIVPAEAVATAQDALTGWGGSHVVGRVVEGPCAVVMA
jgi:phosphoribosylformylglycinamidine cyclo-ligase